MGHLPVRIEFLFELSVVEKSKAFVILKSARSNGNPSLKWRDFLMSTAKHK